MFRSLASLVWGNAKTSESNALIQIPNGSLYKFNKKIEKNKIPEQIVLDSLSFEKIGFPVSLAICSVSNKPHQFSLDVFETEENAIKGRHSFQINLQLKFLIDSERRNFLILFNSELWVVAFVEKEVTKFTLDTFKYIFAQCSWENLNSKPHSEASETIINNIVSGLEHEIAKVHSSNDEPHDFIMKVPLGTQIFKSPDGAATLYEFDKERGIFAVKAAEVTVVLHSIDTYVFALHVGNADGRVHSQYIQEDVREHVDQGTISFVWCYFPDENDAAAPTSVKTFCLRFETVEQLRAFSRAFGECIFETSMKENFKKATQDDLDYLLGRFSPMEIDEMPNDNADESGDDNYQNAHEPDSLIANGSEAEESESENDSDESPRAKVTYSTLEKSSDKNRNEQLAVGCLNDLSFVSRGSSIGVFKTSNDDQDLVFKTNIKDVKDKKGNPVTPKKLLLHDQDTSLLVMSNADPSKVYKMDLDRGKIVEEWQAHPDAKITNILPAEKYAQMTPEQSFIGINQNSIFRMDPRLSSSYKRVDSQMKQYATKYDFSCGATTTYGEIAVGNEKGDIRLYDKIEKNAKSLLPGYGDPIIGIDVSDDGKFIVATCKTYLLLISTTIEGCETKNAFQKSIGSKKPPPKKLQLRPEHVAYIGDRIVFTPAHFSAAEAAGRTPTIVSSTGPYIIIWDLQKVLQGKLYDYQIRKYMDTVVAGDFKYGHDQSIVVALPHHVTVAKKQSLVRPSAKTFQ